MKRCVLFILLLAMSSAIYARDVKQLKNWKFIQSEVVGGQDVAFDDSSWESVAVPHDWAIGKPFDMNIDIQMVQVVEDGDTVKKLRTGRTGALPAFGVGWYRTHISLPEKDRGQKVFVEFDGAMSLAQVYLNGKYIGNWPYGYSSFAFDLTNDFKFGEDNVLAVRLDNKDNSSRWYSGAGLYRNVRLISSNSVYVGHWGTQITTPVADVKKGEVNVKTDVFNESGDVLGVKLVSIVYNGDGKEVKRVASSQEVSGKVVFDQTLKIPSPELWSVENPAMYRVVSELYVGGEKVDSYDSDFGFRTVLFDKDKGFFLNGKAVKIKGVCMHHDLGPLGAAVSRRATERQIEIMKEMGCNAIRTSHNPPSPELLELCDKMGMLVQVEAFDEWRLGKNENGYNKYFDEWAERDIRAMVRRDRNHPSVIMWSIGNEVREQGAKDGGQTAKFLADICREEDSTRPTTSGFNNHDAAIKNGLADVVDLVGFNYKPHDYVAKRKLHPNYVIYGSETASTVSSRGDYMFPVKVWRNPYYSNFQVSSYDLDCAPWASTPDTEFVQQDDNDFVFGEFVWTGFDYLGEPTPYNEGTPARSSYFGIVDLAGMKKDRFYLYQSNWSDKKVLHLLPHWNWEGHDGSNVPVFCYTNYPKAELFVNGKSQGVKSKNSGDTYERYRLMWKDVVYEPGEIMVVAYNENGEKVDSTTIRTASESDKLRLTADRTQIKADGEDLSFVTIEVVDKDGNLCPNAENLLFFNVEGAGKLKAVCNGDATDQTGFHSNYMAAYNGKIVAVIESTEKAGEIVLNVTGSRLDNGKIVIRSL